MNWLSKINPHAFSSMFTFFNEKQNHLPLLTLAFSSPLSYRSFYWISCLYAKTCMGHIKFTNYSAHSPITHALLSLATIMPPSIGYRWNVIPPLLLRLWIAWSKRTEECSLTLTALFFFLQSKNRIDLDEVDDIFLFTFQPKLFYLLSIV